MKKLVAESKEHCTNSKVFTDRSQAFIRRNKILFDLSVFLLVVEEVFYLISTPQFSRFYSLLSLLAFINRSFDLLGRR